SHVTLEDPAGKVAKRLYACSDEYLAGDPERRIPAAGPADLFVNSGCFWSRDSYFSLIRAVTTNKKRRYGRPGPPASPEATYMITSDFLDLHMSISGYRWGRSARAGQCGIREQLNAERR